MAQVTSPGEVIRFGAFELNVSMGELRERGVRLFIQGLPLQILAILAGKPGTLVTREDTRHSRTPILFGEDGGTVPVSNMAESAFVAFVHHLQRTCFRIHKTQPR